MRTARAGRAAAVLTWVYAACFGIPAIPVSAYLLSRGYLPWFLDLFPMYGGPWSSRLSAGWLVGAARAVLIAFAWRSLVKDQHSQNSGIDLDRQPT